MPLDSIQKNAIDNTFNFHYEVIDKLKTDQAIEALNAILNLDVLEDQMVKFHQLSINGDNIGEVVSELHDMLYHQNLVELFRFNDQSLNNEEIKDYTKEQIRNRIELLEKERQEELKIFEAFGHTADKEQLLSLKITSSLREIVLTEPILGKLRAVENFEKFKEKIAHIKKSAALIPKVEVIDRLIDMNDAQYVGATRLIEVLKTGYNDEEVSNRFLKFLNENKNIEQLANKSEAGFNSIIQQTLNARQSPAWFTKQHPKARDQLVLQGNAEFARIASALKAAETDNTLKYFINNNKSNITAFAGVDEPQLEKLQLALKTIGRIGFKGSVSQIPALCAMESEQLNNVQAGLKEQQILAFIHNYPDQLTLLQSMDEQQRNQAALSLDNDIIRRFTNRHPEKLINFIDEAKFAIIAKLMENDEIYAVLANNLELMDGLANSRTSRVEMLYNLFNLFKLDGAKCFSSEFLFSFNNLDDTEFASAITKNMYDVNVIEVIKAIPIEEFEPFIPVISEAMAKDRFTMISVIREIVKIPSKKIELLAPLLCETMRKNPIYCINILDGAMPYQGILLEELSSLAASSLITQAIKIANGYIKDKTKIWSSIEYILSVMPEQYRFAVVSEVLEKVDNPSRRDRLLNSLPEDKRKLANESRPNTIWRAIIDTHDLAHGNSSVEVKHVNKVNRRGFEDRGI